MNRLRRLLLTLLCASILVGAPVREAHAIPLLDQALKILTVPLVFFLGGSSKLQAALMVVNTKLPIILKRMEIEQEKKLWMARDANALRKEQQLQSLQTAQDYAPDITKGNCVAITGGSDVATSEAASTKVRKSVSQQFDVLRGRGWSQTGNDGKSLNPVAQALNEDKNTVCNYGTANDAAAAERCQKTADQLKANPYASANTNAATLLNTGGAYNEDKHFVAAMDYCYMLAGNLPDVTARGRALKTNIENIRQFNLSMSNIATQDVATYSCSQLAYLNLPIDSKFAKTDASIKQNTEQFTSNVDAMSGAAAAAAESGAESGEAPRDYTALDARARKFLIEGCGYTDGVAPTAKVTGETATAANQQLIAGQKVSISQLRKAEYVCKWYSKDYVSKADMNKEMKMANIYITRLYDMQLQWYRYEQKERELLSEAVILARMVRQEQRERSNDPPN